MIDSIKVLQQEQTPILLKNITQQNLLAYFQHSWAIYEWLFSAIKEDETYYTAPDPLRHPLIFYWGHTAAFYINKLKMAGLIKEGIEEHYEELFAKGVDPNLPEHLEKHDLWPTMDDVRAYRLTVKQVVETCIKEQSYPVTVTTEHPLWALLMAIEHDRIHFETSSVLIRQLPVDKLRCPENWEYAPSLGEAPDNVMLKVLGGKVILGKAENRDIFGWDNEYGCLEQEVAPFEASQNLISNQEYLSFYNSGAYQDAQYWSKEGWEWKKRTQTEHPKFWVPVAGTFQYRAMFDLLPMPLDYPVEVNAHEAWAYCKWRGEDYRLMTEAEFNCIAMNDLGDRDAAFEMAYNLNLKYGSPNPVGSLQAGQSSLGFNDLFGNVWDWLQDDFYPLPSFETHYLYRDFSEPYFDDQHSMLLGGAWATTGTGASKYYRLWFRRHFYQHAGFRLAKSL